MRVLCSLILSEKLSHYQNSSLNTKYGSKGCLSYNFFPQYISITWQISVLYCPITYEPRCIILYSSLSLICIAFQVSLIRCAYRNWLRTIKGKLFFLAFVIFCELQAEVFSIDIQIYFTIPLFLPLYCKCFTITPTYYYRQGSKNVLYSIGISPPRLPATVNPNKTHLA